MSVGSVSVRGPGRAGPALPLLPPGHAGAEGSHLLLAVPPVLPLRHALLQLPVLLQAAGPRDPGVQGILALLRLAPLRRRAAPGVPGLRHGEQRSPAPLRRKLGTALPGCGGAAALVDWRVLPFPLARGSTGSKEAEVGAVTSAKMAATLRIQSDWSRALSKDEGEAWLSCRSPGKPTLYGSVTRRGLSSDGVPDIAASEGFVVGEVTKKSILISCPHENVSTKFLAPYTSFCRIHQKSITCLDISSGGGLGVSTSTDGTMKIWQAANGEIRRLLEGHVYDVNCCRFFPSGLVVLSGGMDAQLKVWSAEDASCVVTFKGHKGGILDTAIVDRGRNVLSCSRDGTARLWDCGKSACLGVIADCGAPVNGIATGTADSSLNLGTPEKPPSEREVGTEGKILLLAREDKKLQGVGLQSRQPVFLFVGSDAFNCCTFLSSTYILAGTQDGNIYQLDVRNTNAPIQVIHRSGAPVLSLLPYRDGFIASQGDGTCFIVQQDLDYILDLTEADCDPVYKVASWEKEIYTCCRDGIVRRYQLSDL